MQRLLGLELIIGGCRDRIALIITYVGVRLSLRGLRQVTTTAQEVAAELVARRRGLRAARAGDRGGHRGRAAHRLDEHLAGGGRDAVRGTCRERGADAPVPGRRLARAAHARSPRSAATPNWRACSGRPATARPRTTWAASSPRARGCRGWSRTCCCSRAATPPAPSRSACPVDVSELIHDAVERGAGRLPRPDHRSSTRCPRPAVIGDQDQLLRVVRNLITNAAVHTRPGPAIRVARSATARMGRRSRSSTAGPGCPRRRRRTSSSGSGAPTRPAPAPAAAAGSACRSSPRSSRARRHGALRQRRRGRQHGHRLGCRRAVG